MEKQTMFTDGLRHVERLCAVTAMIVLKGGG